MTYNRVSTQPEIDSSSSFFFFYKNSSIKLSKSRKNRFKNACGLMAKIHLHRNGGILLWTIVLGDEERVSGQDKDYEQPTELVAGKPAYESNQRRYIDAHLWVYLPLWSWRMKLPQSKTKRYLQT
jgi:hypothetical protein